MLMLYDRNEKLIASLKYNKVERKRELNGLNTLEFETEREVEYGQRILFKDRNGLWNEYIIMDYFIEHNSDGISYFVYCEDCTSELYGYFVDDLKPRDEACSSILRRVLEGTRFEVGYVDDFDKKSYNLYRESVKSCLWKMLDQYEAEINVRIVVDKTGILHRYIDLRKKIGRDVGKRFTYKKDVGSIKKTTSIKNLATALHGYGKGEEIVKEDGTPSRNKNKIGDGDYGRKIDFSEINNGKTYVEDNEARLKYGLGRERRHIFGQADFPDCEDKHELLRLTKERLKEVSKPKITYELNVEDISRYEGYIGEGVDLGDVVYVIDKEIDTRVQTRVIAIKDNPVEEIEDSEITLGNFIKDLSDNMLAYDKLKSVFENDRNKFNQELDKLANGVKSSYIQKILDKFNRELNETGGWVYAEEGEGILILNAPKDGNPTQAINLKGGKIAIANHKNADGSFAYETFGDGDGFTANLIRAGVLRGGKVFFNLEDGTFLIGKSPSDYSMYWDGKTLHFRNVDIDLENNSTIKNMIGDINKNKIQQNSKNEKLDKEILDLKSTLKITDGKISSSVESLSKAINEKDGDIRSYIEDNYTKISQTDEMIESKVGQLRDDLKTYESSIKQFKDEINLTVSSFKSGIYKNLIRNGWEWSSRNFMPDFEIPNMTYIENNGDLLIIARKDSSYKHNYYFHIEEIKSLSKEYTVIFEPRMIQNSVKHLRFQLTAFGRTLSESVDVDRSNNIYKMVIDDDKLNETPTFLRITFEGPQLEGPYLVIPRRKLAIVKGWHPNLTWEDIYFLNDDSVEETRVDLKLMRDEMTARVRDLKNNMDAEFKIQANEISSKVSNKDFGTKVRQSAKDIKIAWNNYSKYIQFEYGSIGIYDSKITDSKRRAKFDENGIHFYRDGYYVGKIGTNLFEYNNSKKGLDFDLEHKAAYMCWAARNYSADKNYNVVWLYANESFQGYNFNTLNTGCDIDMHGFTLRNVNFEGGGMSGTIRFKQVVSVNSDGTFDYADSSLTFKNGILVGGSWH